MASHLDRLLYGRAAHRQVTCWLAHADNFTW
jgi:hypothetical protein